MEVAIGMARLQTQLPSLYHRTDPVVAHCEPWIHLLVMPICLMLLQLAGEFEGAGRSPGDAHQNCAANGDHADQEVGETNAAIALIRENAF